MQLSGDQLVLIGGISTLLVSFLKFLLGLFEVKMPRTVLTIVIMVVSLVMGYVWLAPAIAIAFATGDPMGSLGALLNIAVSVVGYATLIYNILLANAIKLLASFITSSDSKSGAE
jgi:hypothetical protein